MAPAGWHVPSDAEWATLSTGLGGDLVAGGKMKETGTTHWNSPNTGATNSSGFTGLPGGFQYAVGTFFDIGVSGNWWSATEYNATNGGLCYLNYGNGFIGRSYNSKRFGFSVRCLKD